MDAILHTLGLCPDSFAHVDFMDIIVCYYNDLQSLIQIIKFRFGL